MDVFGRSGITPGQWNAGEHGRGTNYDAEIKRRMAGGKKPKVDVFTTGFEELDAVLAGYELNLKKSVVRKATREAMKNECLPAFRRILEQEGLVETAALRDVAKVGPAKTKRGSGKIGHNIHIDRELLIAVRSARGGRIGYDKKRNEAFYYLAALEFGTPRKEPKAPLRRALADAARAIIDRVRLAMQRQVDELDVGKTGKRKPAKRTAENQILRAVGLMKPARTKK